MKKSALESDYIFYKFPKRNAIHDSTNQCFQIALENRLQPIRTHKTFSQFIPHLHNETFSSNSKMCETEHWILELCFNIVRSIIIKFKSTCIELIMTVFKINNGMKWNSL